MKYFRYLIPVLLILLFFPACKDDDSMGINQQFLFVEHQRSEHNEVIKGENYQNIQFDGAGYYFDWDSKILSGQLQDAESKGNVDFS